MNRDDLSKSIPRLLQARDGTDPIDLTDFVEEVGGDAPPSLLDDPGELWPAHSGLHSTMLSTASPNVGAESWQNLVEELAAESGSVDDPALRGALQCEAGRILIDRLGRKEEGELLLRKSGSPIAKVLAEQALAGGLSTLASELSSLEAEARDEGHDDEARAAAWIEFGQLCEERTSNLRRAYDAYREALTILPGHAIALALAAEVAAYLGESKAARQLLTEQLSHAESSRLRATLLLDLAELTEDPDERLIVLEQAHHAEPGEETALRRLSRALVGTDDTAQLGQLYRELARVAEDPISSSTALHLAFLTLTEGQHPVDDLVEEMQQAEPVRSDGADLAAPLLEVALYVEQRIAAGEDPKGLPENESLLERLAAGLDDRREQALVREQLARTRLQRLRDTSPDAEGREAWTALCDALERDLRFCQVHLPEHRWINQALAEVLEQEDNMPALVLHLEEWARTQSAGPGRASILLRLGRAHEHRRGELPRAAEIYELAVAEDPDNPNCLRALGGIYEKMRRWPQAVACLRRQVAETHDDPEKLAALRRIAAMAEHELRDIDLAIATLEEVARLDPDDILSLYQLAKLCRIHRRPTVQINALTLLVERVRDDVARTAVLVELGEVQELHLKQRKAARECYEHALRLTAGYTPALGALGRLYRDGGELDALVALLTPATDTVTDPAVLAFKAGRVCFEEIGDIDRAIEYFRTAYEANPDLAPAREMLAQLLTGRGRIGEAYELLRAQDVPRSPALTADYHYRLGLLAEAIARDEQGEEGTTPSGGHPNDDAALQHYRAALRAQPEHGLAFERSRRLLVAYNDIPNLIRLHETFIERGADDAEVVHLIHLARLHLSTADGLDTARTYYQRAFEKSPDDAIVRRELEGLLRLSGDTKSLPALILRSAQASTDTHLKATLLVEAAELLLGTGAPEDHDLAGRAILDALHCDPGNPYAVRHLERLLSEPDSPFVIKDAVSARAVRAQSDAERAIFYVESAELLERVGAWGQARRAYLAAKGALTDLAPADLGLARIASDDKRATAADAGRASVHVLVAEARDAAVRAGRGDAVARARAIKIIGEILQRDAENRDAIALARTLAGQVGDAQPLKELLASVFTRIADKPLRYELGLFLGEHSLALDDAGRYYEAAAKARPDGRRALRGLVNTYRQMGDDRRAAEATERLLELFDPSEPSAIDLRMGIASFLSTDAETLPRAIEHARVVLQARGDDPRAILLMADLLQRANKLVEAASLLDRLAARERNRDKLHDIYLRKAKLLTDVTGQEKPALEAIERAAALNPGNRETVSLLVDQLNRTGQAARVATYLQPIRSALVSNISRGAVSLRDLSLLSTVSRRAHGELARMASVLLYSMEPSPGAPPAEVSLPANRTGLRRILDMPAQRVGLYSAAEPPLLHSLLQTLEGVVARLSRDFPSVGAMDNAPLPPSSEATRLAPYARKWADIVGLPAPRLSAGASPDTVVLLHDRTPQIRIGLNIWKQADEVALRGFIALSFARYALGAPRARALSSNTMDLLLAAAFEAVGVFNPMTADTDSRRLREVSGHLNKLLPPRQRRALERECQGLANHALDGATKATTATDLHVAALITGDVGACLAAACFLDGAAGGSLKQRINRSPTGQELLAHLLSDGFLTAQKMAAQR
ncbi:MAG: tetratricopeptide repeat protein [Nannocystaceae bacterium]|nr:tetratricopeptide repeat protein [Nannocystaceae bacterium]